MGFLYSQLFVTPGLPTKSFTGQTIIVTGANVGLGFEAAKHFARLDAKRIILAVRNLSAGAQAKEAIETCSHRSGVCEVWELDLASYASVKRFAVRASSELDRIDVLLANAGIATTNYSEAEGHERTITVNVISTFLLISLLVPQMRLAAKEKRFTTPHISIVASEVHAWTDLPEHKSENTFAALDAARSDAAMAVRYPASKLLDVLLARELALKLESSGIIVNTLQPGLCHSQLSREDDGWGTRLFKLLVARSAEVGSRTLVAAACAGPESHGAYMADGQVNNGALSKFVQSAEGAAAQKKVWQELMEILGAIEPNVVPSLVGEVQ